MTSQSKNDLSPSQRIGLAALLLTALVLQLGNVFLTQIESPVRGDARDYVAYALNLQSHQVFSRTIPASSEESPPPDALRSPGYPLFLSLILDRKFPDLGGSGVYLAQGLLGWATLVLSMYLFRQLLPFWWAMAAGALIALSPHLINSSVYLLTEPLFTFLLVAHLLLLERGWSKKSAGLLLLSGVLLALSALVRPATLYLPLAYGLLVLLLRDFSWRQRLSGFALLVAPLVLSTTIWSIRNYHSIGAVSDPTLQANFLQHGMYPNMMFEGRPETYGYPYSADPENASYLGDTPRVIGEIVHRLGEDPFGYLGWILIGKPRQFLEWHLTESIGGPFVYPPIRSPWLEQPIFIAISNLMYWIHLPLMILTGLGVALSLWQLRKRPTPGAALMMTMFVYFVGIHMIGAPFPRYSVPLRPVCYGLAVWALYSCGMALIDRVKLRLGLRTAGG